MPAGAHRLIKASAFPSVFKLYVVLVWGVLLYLSMFSGFNFTNQYDSINKKKMPKGIQAGFVDTYLIRIIMRNMEEHVLIQIF